MYSEPEKSKASNKNLILKFSCYIPKWLSWRDMCKFSPISIQNSGKTHDILDNRIKIKFCRCSVSSCFNFLWEQKMPRVDIHGEEIKTIW